MVFAALFALQSHTPYEKSVHFFVFRYALSPKSKLPEQRKTGLICKNGAGFSCLTDALSEREKNKERGEDGRAKGASQNSFV